jgi:hypothetical protein
MFFKLILSKSKILVNIEDEVDPLVELNENNAE